MSGHKKYYTCTTAPLPIEMHNALKVYLDRPDVAIRRIYSKWGINSTTLRDLCGNPKRKTNIRTIEVLKQMLDENAPAVRLPPGGNRKIQPEMHSRNRQIALRFRDDRRCISRTAKELGLTFERIRMIMLTHYQLSTTIESKRYIDMADEYRKKYGMTRTEFYLRMRSPSKFQDAKTININTAVDILLAVMKPPPYGYIPSRGCTPEMEMEIVQLRKDNAPIKEIADKLGISNSKAINVFRKHKLPVRNTEMYIAGIKKLAPQQLTDAEVAKRLGISQVYVTALRIKAGIKKSSMGSIRQDLADQIRIMQNKGIPVAEMARRGPVKYGVLGKLKNTGWVSNQRVVQVEKLLRELGSST